MNSLKDTNKLENINLLKKYWLLVQKLAVILRRFSKDNDLTHVAVEDLLTYHSLNRFSH